MTLSQALKNRVTEAVDQFYGGSPLSAEQAKTHWTLAMEVREHLTQTPDPLPSLEDEIDMDVSAWLLDFPFTLAKHGMMDEALTLGARYAEVTEAENFLSDRAVILAEIGRHDEALARTQENLTRVGEDPLVTIKSGDVYQQFRDLKLAERLYHQGLELSGNDDYTRAGAVERLIPLLDRTGRKEEADALIEEEDAREAHRQQRWKKVLDERVAAQLMALLSDLAADTSRKRTSSMSCPSPILAPFPKSAATTPAAAEKKFKKCCLSSR